MEGHKSPHAGKDTGAERRGQTPRVNRILVVDDDCALRPLIAALLVSSGYRVDTAEDGLAGWMALQANNYDLLITDNNMPTMSGAELVKKLRSEGLKLPVILASGTIPAGELNRDLRPELAAMLLKPFTADELLGTIKAALFGTERAHERIKPRPAWRSQRSARGLQVC